MADTREPKPPALPEEAVQAAAEALSGHSDHPPESWQAEARIALEAAAPVLAAQVRRETAEQIAGAIAGGHKPPEAYWRAWAARVARQIGEARDSR